MNQRGGFCSRLECASSRPLQQLPPPREARAVKMRSEERSKEGHPPIQNRHRGGMMKNKEQRMKNEGPLNDKWQTENGRKKEEGGMKKEGQRMSE